MDFSDTSEFYIEGGYTDLNKSSYEEVNIFENITLPGNLSKLYGGEQPEQIQQPLRYPSQERVQSNPFDQPHTEKYTRKELGSTISSTPVPYTGPTTPTVAMIPQGTILFHGTTSKATFDTNTINLGGDKLISYFTPHEEMAAQEIKGCTDFPGTGGYIHKFRATRDVDNLFVMSVYEKNKNMDIQYYYDNYCTQKNVDRYGMTFNGIAFFNSNSGVFNPDVVIHKSKIAICNPKAVGLEYLSTRQCLAQSQFSSEYQFNVPARVNQY